MSQILNKHTKKFSKTRNLLFINERLRPDFLGVILQLFLLFFAGIIVIPMVMIILRSFNLFSSFSINAYVQAFSLSSTYKALFNTFILSLIALIGAWLVGGFLALVCEKSDFEYKKIVKMLVFISFTIPSYILCISWIEVTGKGGYLNRILDLLFEDFNYHLPTYSLGATALILILHLYPLVFWAISNALKQTNGVLIKGAKVFGADNKAIIRHVIIPLMMPTFFSTGVLVFSRCMANFGVAAQLALPVGKEVLTTRIFSAISQLDLPLVSVLSLILVALSYVVYYYSQLRLRKKSYDLKQTDNQYDNEMMHLGKWKGVVNGVIALFFLVATIIPLITIFLSSLLKRWGLKIELSNMTLKNYKIMFIENDMIQRALFNSITYGIVCAVVAALMASLCIYNYVMLNKNKITFNVMQLPIAFPNIILAIGAILAWINLPIKIYGTQWIIMMTYVVLFIPICIKQILGLAKNIDISTEQSAQTLGLNFSTRYMMIFLPQVGKGMTAGMIICFLIALREIPISLLLYSNGTETLGVMLFTIQSNSYGLEMTSTIAVVVICISIIGQLLLKKIGVRRNQS